MPTVLITGANRGLGFEFTRQYLADGWRVIATCRKPEDADQLNALAEHVEVHHLDVTDFAEVEALGDALENEAIDLLLNNAGIYGPRSTPLGGLDFGAWEEVLRVNTLSPLKVSECFADQVARSSLKLIVTVTSKMGSMTDNSSGGSYFYRSSKAALNAVMKSLSVDLAERAVKVAVLHPGWVRTDMGGDGALIDADESVTGMRKVIASLQDADSGKFFDYKGNEVPW